MRIKVLILYLGGRRPGGSDREETVGVQEGRRAM